VFVKSRYHRSGNINIHGPGIAGNLRFGLPAFCDLDKGVKKAISSLGKTFCSLDNACNRKIHMVTQTFPGSRISGQFDHRDEREPLRRPPARGECDKVAAGSGQSCEDFRFPARRIHDNQTVCIRFDAIFIHGLNRGGSALCYGSQRFFLNGGQPALDVSTRRLPASHVAADGLGPVFHTCDKAQDLLSDFFRGSMFRDDVFRTNKFRNFSENGGAAGLDDLIGNTANHGCG